MSKSGSRYGRRSNWFKIHCLLQEQQQAAVAQAAAAAAAATQGGPMAGVHSVTTSHPSHIPTHMDLQKSLTQSHQSVPHPAELAGFFAQTFAQSLQHHHPAAPGASPFLSHLYRFPPGLTIQQLQEDAPPVKSPASDSGTSSAEDEIEQSISVKNRLKINDNFYTKSRFQPYNNNNNNININNNGIQKKTSPSPVIHHPLSPSSDPGTFFDKKVGERQFSPPPNRVSVSSLSWPNTFPLNNGLNNVDPSAWKDLWLRTLPSSAGFPKLSVPLDNNNKEILQEQPIDLSIKQQDVASDRQSTSRCNENDNSSGSETTEDVDVSEVREENTKTPLDLTLGETTKRGSELIST